MANGSGVIAYDQLALWSWACDEAAHHGRNSYRRKTFHLVVRKQKGRRERGWSPTTPFWATPPHPHFLTLLTELSMVGICTPAFVAVFFTISQGAAACMAISTGMDKHIVKHSGVLFSLRREEMLPRAPRQLNHMNVALSETVGHNTSWLSLFVVPEIVRFIRTGS